LAVALVGTACERTLDFVDAKDKSVSDMALNAVAVVGSPLRVYLNHAYPVNKAPMVSHIDNYTKWGPYDGGRDTDYFDYVFWDYYKDTGIYDAELKAVVNGSDTYMFTLASDSLGFDCDYMPREGDHIVLTATRGNVQVQAETTVPAKPRIEILEKEILAENPYREHDNVTFDTDTLMQLSCRIVNGDGQPYYRLRVRDESSITNGVRVNDNPYTYYTRYLMQDIFYSNDELFVDNRLNANFGGWPAYFSNVFDNTLLTNDYTFTVYSPKYELWKTGGMSEHYEELKVKPGTFYYPPAVMVELQAITPDLYRYLKSMELYRITANDDFSEPVHIYGNVKNGWGIFGSLSYDRHMVAYEE